MKKISRQILSLAIAILTIFSCVSCAPIDYDFQRKDIKNVILMIGDGMGQTHEEAGRIYKGADLAWDNEQAFRFAGEVLTRSMSTREDVNQPTDSAAAATAMATGNKVLNGSISMYNEKPIQSIMELAASNGKATGVVTSDLLSGATPSAFSAHASGRNDVKDIIASQASGSVQLLLGADKNKDYETNKQSFQSAGYHYVNTPNDLNKKALQKSKLIGAFPDVQTSTGSTPNAAELKQLTAFALDYLSQDKDGFCLMIEGAKIDKSSHGSQIGSMLSELMAFDECVQYVAEWAAKRGDTNVIVTADHETGGLTLKANATKSNILNKGSYAWTAQGAHTTSNVHYYVMGAKSNLYQDIIENTTVFYMMRDFVLSDVGGYEEELREIQEQDLRIGGMIFDVKNLPQNVPVGDNKGNIALQYNPTQKILTLTLQNATLDSGDYCLYAWNMNVVLKLEGQNVFQRTDGRAIVIFGGSLQLKGSGSLTTTGNVRVDGNLTIQDTARLTIHAKNTGDALSGGQMITVQDGAKLTVQTNEEIDRTGITAKGLSIQDSGEVLVDGFVFNLYLTENLTVNGGKLDLQNATDSAVCSFTPLSVEINSGTFHIASKKNGIQLPDGNSQMIIGKNTHAGQSAPVVTVQTPQAAFIGYTLEIVSGTFDVTVASADALQVKKSFVLDSADVTVQKTGAKEATGIILQSGATAKIKGGNLTVDGFGYGIATWEGGSLTVESAASVTLDNNTTPTSGFVS